MRQTPKFMVVCVAVWAMLSTTKAQNTVSTTDLSPMIDKLAAELAPRLAAARYMEKNPEPVVVPGWEGFPTMLCTYPMLDRGATTNKIGKVILLDADAHRMALWMVNSCIAAKGAAKTNDLKKLADRIIGQSGGQYPVRGIVYEDFMSTNGINQLFPFFDGVTVRINGVDYRSEKQQNPEQMDRLLKATINDVTWVGQYARVQSTTRPEYKAAGGKENADGTNFLKLSRELYQKAWNTGTNDLMTAWVKAHL